jgi:hypothetical protein
MNILLLVEKANLMRVQFGKSYITNKGFTIIPGKNFVYETMIVKKKSWNGYSFYMFC